MHKQASNHCHKIKRKKLYANNWTPKSMHAKPVNLLPACGMRSHMLYSPLEEPKEVTHNSIHENNTIWYMHVTHMCMSQTTMSIHRSTHALMGTNSSRSDIYGGKHAIMKTMKASPHLYPVTNASQKHRANHALTMPIRMKTCKSVTTCEISSNVSNTRAADHWWHGSGNGAVLGTNFRSDSNLIKG